MNDHNKEQQLRYLEEVCIPLHRAGFETQPLDESQLPVHWNGAPLCRITGKGSVFYRRDYERTGVTHGHYFMENYDGAKQDFVTRSGLIHKEQLFSPEQMTEIYRCCADSVDGEFFELTDKQEEVIRSVQQQIEVCVPDLNERIRQQEEALEQASQEQTM